VQVCSQVLATKRTCTTVSWQPLNIKLQSTVQIKQNVPALPQCDTVFVVEYSQNAAQRCSAQVSDTTMRNSSNAAGIIKKFACY
jgi:hypothetical protein